MAVKQTVTTSSSISSTSMGEEPICSVCLEGFQEPKVLPCCHSFCLKCLEGILERAKDKGQIACPQCKTKHQIPPNGPQGFTSDYTIGRNRQTGRQSRSHDLLCDHCEDANKAHYYCTVCSEHFCEQCLKAHNRLRQYRTHEIVNVATEQFDRAKHQSKVYNCSHHPSEQLKLYCKACQTLACVYCFASSHNGHDIGSIDSKTRNGVEEVIRNLMEQSSSKLTEFRQNLQHISRAETNKTEESTRLKTTVNNNVDILIAQIVARRTELHKEIDDKITEDQKQLWAQKEYHEINILKLEGVLKFARRTLTCSEHTELLALGNQVTVRLKELSELTWDPQLLEEIETRRLEVKHSEPALLQDIGELHTIPLTPSITLYPDQTSRQVQHYRGSKITFQITAAIEVGGKQFSRRIDLTGSAKVYNVTDLGKSLGKVPVEKDPTGLNRWTMTFTPYTYSKAERYRITFTAKGKYYDKTLCNQYSCDIKVPFGNKLVEQPKVRE